MLASRGYPNSPEIGFEILGLDKVDPGVLVFPGGMTDGKTSGGRVLTVAALGDTYESAREVAYNNIRRISFEGCWFRGDIAAL